jgi:copper homeostasis protein CutC
MEGISTLIEIQDAVKPAIQVIAAGKVTSQNISEIRDKTGLNYFHGRKIV